MKRKISLIANNHITSHYRIYSLFNKKGYSIEEVQVKSLEKNPSHMKMTLWMNESEDIISQAKKYLSKLFDVIYVEDI